MLNRRTLRIKAMQMMFAYEQMVEANYEISLQFIKDVFSPDLNSMDFQDKDELGKNQIEALKLYKERFTEDHFSGTKGHIVEEKVEEAILQYHQQNAKDFASTCDQMIEDVNHLYSSYISFLELLIVFQREAGDDVKRNHTNFVNNMLIKRLKLNKSLEKAILELKFRWDDRSEAREWFRTLISKDETYQHYNSLSSPNFEEDFKIVKYLISRIVFSNNVVETFLAENDLHWDENKPVVKSLLLKTVKSVPNDDSEFSLQQVSYNFEEDREFFVKLFRTAVNLPAEYSSLIGKKALNWDIERLALTDRIILELAIAELINFPSIPVKVTINEYIEVSKKYSTPKSKKFINGMLDVIAEDLKKDGVLRKSGRGLIDNK